MLDKDGAILFVVINASSISSTKRTAEGPASIAILGIPDLLSEEAIWKTC